MVRILKEYGSSIHISFSMNTSNYKLITGLRKKKFLCTSLIYSIWLGL
jgi:hypothetical protein